MVLNRVNIIAVNAKLVLHVGKTGRRTVGRTPLGLHVPWPLGLHVPRLAYQCWIQSILIVFLMLGSIFGVIEPREYLRKTSFEKCCTTS